MCGTSKFLRPPSPLALGIPGAAALLVRGESDQKGTPGRLRHLTAQKNRGVWDAPSRARRRRRKTVITRLLTSKQNAPKIASRAYASGTKASFSLAGDFRGHGNPVECVQTPDWFHPRKGGGFLVGWDPTHERFGGFPCKTNLKRVQGTFKTTCGASPPMFGLI